ncbi:MAG: DUF4384 domain-containing protein [Leptospiraceae bacterium]|nr:DUF4384 domain-containing protein [Leptospiraceae bacterium]
MLIILCLFTLSLSCQTPAETRPTGPKPDPVTETIVKEEVQGPVPSAEEKVNPALDARRGAVAILPFRINGAENREVGAGVSSRLVARLQSRNQFQIVERLDLDQIQKELLTGQSGLIDGDSAARIGRLVGARYLVLGEWSDGVGNQKKGSYRIVVAETGRLIGSGISMGPEEEVLRNFERSLARQLAIYQSLDNPESPYSILLQLDREDHLYRLGDRVEVSFEIKRYRNEAPSRVYLQLYAIDSEGVMTMIYPNRFSGIKPLEVGKKYTFPAESDPFEWKLVRPAGTETIQAFVTTEPVDPFKATDKMQDGFVQVSTRGHSLETFSGIVTVLKEEETEGWSADRITFEIQD